MEFRILGPVEVVGVDGPVQLRGAKRRGLVALFLINVGQRLSIDRIVDDLWGTDAVPGAAGTVQTYVSQLRRVLDGIEASITTHDGGYALELEPEKLDAWRFEHLVRRAAGLDDAATRVRCLDEALALWRGPALDGFDDAWAARERARLDLLRLQAQDLLLDARLELGNAGDLLDQLETLVDEHPLDERFWAKLLVAYYRCGRQGDALSAFQRARAVLAEQLGIEPGPLLTDLERRVLDQDPSLLAATPTSAATAATSTASLPSGTVTFLFTDMVDSTRLWEEQPEAMQQARIDADALVTRAIEDHEGHVVKSTGDGLMAVFADPNGAVGAAVEALRSIERTSWPVPVGVRMGMHTGTAEVDGGDYHAPAVNRAARVATTAHPGQILVSEATAALVDDADLRDLGEHRLRGLAPMRLHQVLHPELRADFPRAQPATVSGLPTPATRFVGRRKEAEAITQLLAEHRLVTLTGAGGCGKTRLAVEVARDLAGDLLDGVRFVDLAAITDEAAVDEAVTDALGLAASLGTADPHERLVAHLGSRQMLLVLDNCEHLLDSCADLVDEVLATEGSSRILATSRESLGVMGEQVLRVPSLPAETDGVTLFADRAQAVRAEFTLDAANAGAVEQICRRLDGIPLAIELAAARVSHLAPMQMLDRLDDRFRLLTGGRRRIQRQQTLAATLDWSYELLGDEDREVLQALAAFPAGFSLDAAEAVVGRSDTLERLGSLVDKSLLQTVDDEHGLRYRMLETVRLYAEDKLVGSGQAATCRSRQARWVHDWLESKPLDERWGGDIDLLSTDLPNIRAALEWSANEGDLETTARLATGVDWTRTEAWSEGARWCEQLSTDQSLGTELRFWLVLMLWQLGPLTQSSTHYGRQLLELSEDGPRTLRALAHMALARDLIVPPDLRLLLEAQDEAIGAAEMAVAQIADGAQGWQLAVRLWAGMIHAAYRQPEEALVHAAAVTAEPPDGPYRGLHAALRGLQAVALFVTDHVDEAQALAREVFSPRALVPYWHHPRALSLVALAGSGDVEPAKQALRDYREANRDLDWIYAQDSVPLLGGVLAGVGGDWPTASRLLAAGRRAMRRSPTDYLLYATFRDRAHEHLGSERSRRFRDEGLAMPIEQAIDLALDLPG